MRTESERINRTEENVLTGTNSFRMEPKQSANNVDLSFDFRKMEINTDLKILENYETREELISLILKHIKKRGYSIAVELTTSFISEEGHKEYFVTISRDDLKKKEKVGITELLNNKIDCLLDKAHNRQVKKNNLPVFS